MGIPERQGHVLLPYSSFLAGHLPNSPLTDKHVSTKTQVLRLECEIPRFQVITPSMGGRKGPSRASREGLAHAHL